MVGSKKARFFGKNQYTQRKSWYFENTGRTSSSKIRRDFRKSSGSKIEVRKKCVYKKWFPKLLFLNDFLFEKNPFIFDIEN